MRALQWALILLLLLSSDSARPPEPSPIVGCVSLVWGDTVEFLCDEG